MRSIAEIDRKELLHRCKKILADHVGQENAIKSENLFVLMTGQIIIPKRANDQTRIVRSIVKQLESEGVRIVHVTGKNGGYFMATCQEDIDRKIAWFMKRIKSAFKRVMHLGNMTFDDVFKQLEIDFKEKEE